LSSSRDDNAEEDNKGFENRHGQDEVSFLKEGEDWVSALQIIDRYRAFYNI